MCDEDIIARLAKLFGLSYCEMSRQQQHYKRAWLVQVRGKRARKWMQTLRPLMGIRRKQQIDAALASYDPSLSRQKLDEDQVREIKQLIAQGNFTQREIAARFQVERTHISRIKHGKSWPHIK